MSFDALEYSVEDGEPYELYSFVSQGGGLEYYFTTSYEAKTFEGNVYQPMQIMRTIFDVSAVIESPATVDITMARAANALAARYGKPYSPPTLTIRVWRGHEGDSEHKKKFVGRSESFALKGDFFVIKAKPLIESLCNRVMCSTQFGKKCNFELFDERCKVVEADYTWDTTVTAINGQYVTVADDFNADNALQFGDIIINGEYRVILSNTANVIKVRYPFTIADVSDAVVLKKGCSKTYAVCNNDFDNHVNFGGFNLTPKINPTKTAVKPGLFTNIKPIVNG